MINLSVNWFNRNNDGVVMSCLYFNTCVVFLKHVKIDKYVVVFNFFRGVNLYLYRVIYVL